MTIIKVVLLAGVLVLMRLYLLAPRSSLRDRLILLPLSAFMIVSIIEPDLTSWVANRIGVSRGADLVFYLGFLMVFFVLGTLRIQVREQQAEITTIVRELGLLQRELREARQSAAGPAPGPNGAPVDGTKVVVASDGGDACPP